MPKKCVDTSVSVFTVRPKRAYLDWALSLPGAFPMTLEDMMKDTHAYIVPDLVELDATEKAVKKYFKSIFERELQAWDVDPATWPRKRTLPVFKEWFDVGVHSMVFEFQS